MATSDVLLAIEALCYDKESRNINRHLEYLHNILKDTFFQKSRKNEEGVGSRFEGLEGCSFQSDISVYTIDSDFVQSLTKITVPKIAETGCILGEETISIEHDLKIISCPQFPGYVKLKLLKHDLLFTFLPNNVFHKKNNLEKEEINDVNVTQNGPAVTHSIIFEGCPNIVIRDTVKCFTYNTWPVEASEWTARNKPNNWPSNKLIEKITSKGFNLAPVGHYDCDLNEHDLHWRIGIRGEKDLFLNLNETQILCYVALRMILKGDIQQLDHTHKDALSSFHMKNVIFWCVEQESCQWTKKNFDICLKTCINKLIQFITSNRFPHYFIESRNLINSKFTDNVKQLIVRSLNKYRDHILAIMSLNEFDQLKKETSLKVTLLECAKQKSIVRTCLGFYIYSIANCYIEPNELWETFEGHDTAVNLKNAQRILSILQNGKRHFINHYIAYAKNILGLLYYSRYKETYCKIYSIKARKLLNCSLTFENVSLKFRVANFYFMENELDSCLKFVNAFLTSQSKCKSANVYFCKFIIILFDIFKIIEMSSNSVTKQMKLKKKIVSIFYNKRVSEKCGERRRLLQAKTLIKRLNKTFVNSPTVANVPEFLYRNGTLYDNILLLFENFVNLCFCDTSFNVPYIASEKWAVPEVIQYELFSVTRCHPESKIYGIYIDPELNCLILAFLCYQARDNWVQRDVMLTKLIQYSDEYSKLTVSGKKVAPELPHSLPLYRVYNIAAYCCIKAERYRTALNYIWNSFNLFPRRENTAYGYIRCLH